MPLILHIGASKCGSSAIQTALTQRAEFVRRNDSPVEYVAINNRGQLIRGEQLQKEAGIRGYSASPDAKIIKEFDLTALGKALKSIKHDFILSSEGWIFQAGLWRDILNRMGMKAHVVAYVRPHVSLLNSAWWQWGAWSDVPFDAWMEHRLAASMWARRLHGWNSLNCVESLTVRLVSGDVTDDFFNSVLDSSPLDTRRTVNQSLPASVLRLLQRNRLLRPGPHRSEVVFALTRHLNPSGAAPWVLSRRWVSRILSETREDNLKLIPLLDEKSSEAMRANPEWWDPEAYAEKVIESPDPIAPDIEQLEELCVSLITALGKSKI